MFERDALPATAVLRISGRGPLTEFSFGENSAGQVFEQFETGVVGSAWNPSR
jgi:hypothetical protein